jgi:hypothetical protein
MRNMRSGRFAVATTSFTGRLMSWAAATANVSCIGKFFKTAIPSGYIAHIGSTHFGEYAGQPTQQVCSAIPQLSRR